MRSICHFALGRRHSHWTGRMHRTADTALRTDTVDRGLPEHRALGRSRGPGSGGRRRGALGGISTRLWARAFGLRRRVKSTCSSVPTSGRATGAVLAREADSRPGRDELHERSDRQAAIPCREHRQESPLVGVWQARGAFSQRGGEPHPRSPGAAWEWESSRWGASQWSRWRCNAEVVPGSRYNLRPGSRYDW